LIDLQGLPLLWLVVVAATLLRSFTGFGFALTAVPGLALLYSPTEAVVLSASLALALGVQTFPQYRQHVDLKLQWPMFATSIVGTVLGAQLLQGMDREIFLGLIGGLVIIACLALARFHPRRRPAKPALVAGSGLASGLINGAFAIPGPPIIIYVMSTVPDPRASRALMMAFFGFSSLIALVTYSVAGWVHLELFWLALSAYPAVVLGDWVGSRLFRHYGGAMYRRVAIAALLLLGVSILLKAIV
jgi:uncharacterized membrane protein YfcA